MSPRILSRSASQPISSETGSARFVGGCDGMSTGSGDLAMSRVSAGAETDPPAANLSDRSLSEMKIFVVAHIITVSTFQFDENERGKDGKCAKDEECLVETVKHLPWIGTDAIRYE